MARVALVFVLLLAGEAAGSDAVLTGNDGHPRERLPLALFMESFDDPALDAAARRAADDWNRVARDVVGVGVFAQVGTEAGAAVIVRRKPAEPGGAMGVTSIESGASGVITLPVTVVVHEPAPRGQTTRETLLYQVLAHELGHALGLAHTTDPTSLMCCVHGSVDFNDPAVRAAYVEARRHPDVASTRAQLRAHYGRFWRR